MLKCCILLAAVVACYANVKTATDRLFILNDKDRDGSLSNSEIMDFLKDCDTRGHHDLRISEAEFFHCANHNNQQMHQYAVSLFHAFDIGQKRWISINDDSVQAIMNAFDGDGNGEINEAEFAHYLHQRLHSHTGTTTK